jgi:isochorismate hydrolase
MYPAIRFLAPLLALAVAVAPSVTHADKKLPDHLTPDSAAILLVDHQKLTVDWIKSQSRATFLQNIRMLTRLAVEGNVPLVVTSTMEDQVAGPTLKDIQELAPKAYAARIRRGGTLNAFADPTFRAAVKATGRKRLIIAGLMPRSCSSTTRPERSAGSTACPSRPSSTARACSPAWR